MELTKEYLYDNYIVKDKSERQIAEELNIGEGKVDYWVRKLKLNFKKASPDKVFNLKHIDDSDPIFCYFAGLMATDGYLDYKNKRISLRVNNEGSKEVFEALRAHFEFIRPVNRYIKPKSKRPMYDLTIPNSCIFKELESMGIFGKKDYRAFSLDWYTSASKSCKQMFLRGVLDGDGNIHKKGGNFRIAMKSEEFIKNLLVIFNNLLDDTYVMKYQANSTTDFKYPAIWLHKYDSIKFYNFIYQGFEQYRFIDKYNKYINVK